VAGAMERIVLAYSGGLQTSVGIPWLRDTRGAELIAVTVDLGQGQELEEVRDRAVAAGAVRAHVLDLREELARDFVVPAIKADAVSETGVPLGAALGRPLIAHALVNIAAIEQAPVVAHAAPIGGSVDARLDAAIHALNPALRVVALARDWAAAPFDAADYARQRRMPVPIARTFSVDANLWGRAVSGGVLDDPWPEPPEEIYALTKAPADRPAEAAYVEIAFERGVPAAINGVAMPLLDIISSLTTIAGAHGVGRLDAVEHDRGDVARRTVHEAPAAVVLHAAHHELQSLVSPPDLARVARIVRQQYTDVVIDGRWFSPLRDALDAFVDRVQERVTGTVRLKLFKGDCRIVGRKSPHAPGAGAVRMQPAGVGA
jgi:argininosuccinate synthase